MQNQNRVGPAVDSAVQVELEQRGEQNEQNEQNTRTIAWLQDKPVHALVFDLGFAHS
jgi:hypothetical protein